MASRKIEIAKERSVGYGYIGQWVDGRLGWCMPKHFAGRGKRYTQPPNEESREYASPDGERFFLCEITVRPLFDKKGRPITKIVRKKAK